MVTAGGKTYWSLARLVAVALAGILLAGVSAAASQSAAASAAPSSMTAPDAKVRTVTLITGDEVVVATGAAGPRVVDVRPAPGRGRVHFFTQQWGDGLHVVPADAVEPLARRKLDRRLFDVGRLAELEHGDRGALPLIVQYRSAALHRSAVAELPAGARRTARLDAIHAEAVSVDRGAARALWKQLSATDARAVGKVWLDGERRLSLDVSVPMVRAPEAWAAGYTGQGTTVAVLDSGIDATHPDFAGAIVEARNFTSEPDTDDTAGHGTHVASIVTGSGSASSGQYQGVASDTQLLIGKVCGGFGTCPDSAVLAGMEWAAESGADVVNLSLGGPDTRDLDPLEQAVAELTEEHGVLFVVAAGNDGEDGPETVASPASADAALAVGSVSKSAEMSFSSSQGPRVGDAALKPDVAAPGVNIIAGRAKNGWMGGPVDEHYTSISGTSMAAPHVAGAAAILVQRHPQWTPTQIKAALMGAADPLAGVGAFRQGSGLLDVAEAISLPVTASPAGVSFGIQRWPHDDDQPITKTVTYRNASDQPLTLGLSLQTVGPDGQPAPAGMFQLDRSALTVPAGGQAEAAITADTRVAAPDGHYTGWIVASSGATELTTPFGVDKSIEAYDVTFELRGRDGERTSSYQLSIGRYGEEFWRREPYEPDGELTIRLPAGRYVAVAQIAGSSEEGPTTTLLTVPNLRADADKRIVLDAQSAKPISVTMPEPVGRARRRGRQRLRRGRRERGVRADQAVLGYQRGRFVVRRARRTGGRADRARAVSDRGVRRVGEAQGGRHLRRQPLRLQLGLVRIRRDAGRPRCGAPPAGLRAGARRGRGAGRKRRDLRPCRLAGPLAGRPGVRAVRAQPGGARTGRSDRVLLDRRHRVGLVLPAKHAGRGRRLDHRRRPELVVAPLSRRRARHGALERPSDRPVVRAALVRRPAMGDAAGERGVGRRHAVLRRQPRPHRLVRLGHRQDSALPRR